MIRRAPGAVRRSQRPSRRSGLLEADAPVCQMISRLLRYRSASHPSGTLPQKVKSR